MARARRGSGEPVEDEAQPTAKRKWSSGALLNLVQAQRHPAGEWAFIRELAIGTGSHGGRWIDAWAMHCWPSQAFRTVAYEVKVSRGDFARELLDPTKRGAAAEVAGECWFLTPSGLVRPDEVPESWGLVEARDDGTLVNRKLPTQREVKPPSMPFFAAVARRCADPKLDPVVAQLHGRELKLSDLERLTGVFAQRVAALRPVKWEEQANVQHATTRDRLVWIEEELRTALGWGATRSREELRGKLATLAESQSLGLSVDTREQLANTVRRLCTLVGLRLEVPTVPGG